MLLAQPGCLVTLESTVGRSGAASWVPPRPVLVAGHLKIQGGRHSKNPVLPVSAMESVKGLEVHRSLLASERERLLQSLFLLIINAKTHSAGAITRHLKVHRRTSALQLRQIKTSLSLLENKRSTLKLPVPTHRPPYSPLATRAGTEDTQWDPTECLGLGGPVKLQRSVWLAAGQSSVGQRTQL